MKSRSIAIARDGQNLHLWFGKKDPATGAFFDDTQVTAATVSIYAKDGTELLAATAMSYVANLRGYVYDWNPSAALDARPIVYVYITPTRAGSVAAALAPDEVYIVDVADTLKRQDEIEVDIDALENPSATAIADAVWDETLTSASHDVADSAGRRLRHQSSSVRLE